MVYQERIASEANALGKALGYADRGTARRKVKPPKVECISYEHGIKTDV